MLEIVFIEHFPNAGSFELLRVFLDRRPVFPVDFVLRLLRISDSHQRARRDMMPSMQRSRSGQSASLLAVVGLFGASGAFASEVELNFSGMVDASNLPSIPVGSTFSGYVLYQTPGIVYLASGTTTSFSFGTSDMLSLSTGAYTFSVSGSNAFGSGDLLQVDYHDSGVDVYTAGNAKGPAAAISSGLPGFSPDFLEFQIAGSSGLLASDGLPINIDFSHLCTPGCGNASTGITVESFGSPGFPYFTGDFNSFEIQTVPELSTGTMLTCAVLAFVLGGSWRHQQTIPTAGSARWQPASYSSSRRRHRPRSTKHSGDPKKPPHYTPPRPPVGRHRTSRPGRDCARAPAHRPR